MFVLNVCEVLECLFFKHSWFIFLLSFSSTQIPPSPIINQTILSLQSYNKALDNDSLRLSGLQAVYYVIYGSFCEMLGFLMGIFLALFLRQLYNEAAVTLVAPSGAIQRESFFTNKLYMVATGLVPPLINLYFHIQSTTENNNTPPSCLDHASLAISNRSMVWKRYGEDHANMRGFPVVIIFHTVATACCWFMDMQQSQQNNNLLGLEKLRKELTTARTELATKKTS